MLVLLLTGKMLCSFGQLTRTLDVRRKVGSHDEISRSALYLSGTHKMLVPVKAKPVGTTIWHNVRTGWYHYAPYRGMKAAEEL
jgi:hypothetical protein